MGIANSFDQYPREWHQWYTSDSPETTPLPGTVIMYCMYCSIVYCICTYTVVLYIVYVHNYTVVLYIVYVHIL